MSFFEKESEVGGKAVNYEDPSTGLKFPMGPYYVTEDDVQVMKWIRQFNIEIKPVPRIAEYDIFEWESGDILTRNGSIEIHASLKDAVARYEVYHNHYSNYLVPNYKNGIPKELTLPFLDWLQNLKLEKLQPHFSKFISAMGYGKLTDIPAVYALNYMRPYLLKALLGYDGFTLYFVDYNLLFKRLAASLQSEIILNATVYDVQRVIDEHPGNELYTAYRVNGEEGIRACRSIVIAFPFQYKELKFLSDNDLWAITVLGYITTTSYYSGIVDAPKLDLKPKYNFLHTKKGVKIQGVTEGVGQPMYIHHIHPRTHPNLATFYAWDEQMNSDLKKVWQTSVTALSKLNGNTSLSAQSGKAFQKWNHFPHVYGNVLADEKLTFKGGFYDAYRDLQGHVNTYYISGVQQVDWIERVIESAFDMVDSAKF